MPREEIYRMRIDKDIEIVALGLYFRDKGLLTIADLHVGYEEALAEQGIHIPVSQYPKMKKILSRMIDAVEPEKIVIVGDVKHEFGSALRQEWVETLDLLDFLKERVNEVIVVRGNHDNYLIPILKRKEVPLYDPNYVYENVLFLHGHKPVNMDLFKENIEIIVMGHEHPAIALRDELGVKIKFKCLLKGVFEEKSLFVLPVFSPLMTGTEINLIDKDRLLSHLLKIADLENFNAYITDLEAGIYYFGKIGFLRSLLSPSYTEDYL